MTIAKKVTHLLVVFLILSAFCIVPVFAGNADTVDDMYVSEPKGVTHMSEAFCDKSSESYQRLLELKEKYPDDFTPLPYAYMGITNCLKPTGSVIRCELHDVNDPTNPHPIWADWLELEHNNPVKVLVDESGGEYAVIYPPRDEEPAPLSLLPGARAGYPVFVVGLGRLVIEVSKDTALYSLGVATLAGFVSVFSENFDEVVKTIHTFRKDVIDHIAYLKAVRLAYKELGGFQYHELNENKRVKGELTTQDAIDKMKDCEPKKHLDEPKKIDRKNVVRIFSTEEGCRKISEFVTKLLGGLKIEYGSSKGGKLAHYHPGRPLDEYGKYQHCYAHCYFKEEQRREELPHTDL